MQFNFKARDVYLRAFEPEDVPALHNYLNHPDLSGRRYIPWKFSDDLPLSLKKAQGIYEKWSEEEEEIHLAVVLGESGELIGHAEMEWGWDPHCPGVSIVIAPGLQRKGYGSQVMQLLLRYLFESMPAHSLSCWVAEWNTEARAFLKLQGFQESARMRRAGIRQGAYFDMVVTDLLRSEWEGGRDAAGR
jgi:RimJ/RimL family protein N-acetyltransferase